MSTPPTATDTTGSAQSPRLSLDAGRTYRPTPAYLGLARRLQRLCDSGGIVCAAAIDHPENYVALFDADVGSVPFDEVVRSKLDLAQALAEHASALLLDPVWSIGPAVATMALPRDVGLVTGLEALYYEPASAAGFDTTPAARETWRPTQLAALGVDGAKLVVFTREDEEPTRRDAALNLVADTATECHEHQLPLIVEPLWYPVEGESLKDRRTAETRRRSVVSTASAVSGTGADLLKLEFPSLPREERTVAEDACAELAEAATRPWVLLSAGVTFDQFAAQLDVATQHGCSGFMAGRAVWSDAVGRMSVERRDEGRVRAAERMRQLTAIARTGRALLRPLSVDDACEEFSPGWHEGFPYP